jgi:hypothetical protein
MRVRSFCLGLIVCFVLLLVAPATTQIMTRNVTGLASRDRELLADSRAQGKSTVMLMIAAVPGYTSAIVTSIEKMGGSIRFRDNDLNYVRAIVPIERVENIIGLNGVDAAKIDELVALDDPAPEGSGGTMAVPPQPPGPSTPPLNPYMPTRDIGAPQFVQAHPAYDGRGVKIGIVDTGVDLLTPELQSAKMLDGTPVRKVVDWVNMNDPLDPAASDPSWINMQTQVSVSGGSFTVGSLTYTGVPADGTYRFGIFDEGKISADSSSQNSEYAVKAGGVWCADLNRNGVCHETFAVLWRTSDNTVWVDSNADRSFASEPAMKDYMVKYDMGVFGTDNPATPVRESVPFVVQTDGRDKYVNIGVVGAAHATHVAGIAAGKGFFGGEFNGAAPEAQVVSVRACLFSNSCTLHGMMEGMIYVSKQANVDVINMSIGGLGALNDGRSVFSILYNRLIDQTKAQMFISAGNAGPGVNTVGDPSISANVMSVGASVTKDTWYSNYGVDAAKNDGLFPFSSRGPTEAGGFKPDIVAPGCAISTIPGWQPGQAVSGTYSLPPGYAMFNGTSMASPEATGGAALLISAAMQSGAQHRPDQLRRAINSSARFLPGYGAHEQGNGLFQVANAWSILQSNIQTAEITSSAPVETVLSDYLEVPHMGTGIYQREGWSAGDMRVLNIIFTRKKGTAKPVSYNLTWVGNDGTFSSSSTIALPRDVAVALPVTVSPQTAGIHSAILNLASDSGSGFDYQVMNTVIAADQLTSPNGYSASRNGSADRPDKAAFFFYVPPVPPSSNPLMRFELAVSSGSVRLWAIDPQGLPYGYTSATSTSLTASISNPASGVWEVTMETNPASTVTPAAFSIKVSLMGATISPPSWTIVGATPMTTYSQAFTFTNNLAPFTGNAQTGILNSTFMERSTITAGVPQYHDIMVPASTFFITANTGNPSNTAADIDLYLYDCTAGPDSCVLKSSSAYYGAFESVYASSPKSGLWRVMVLPKSIPSGSLSFDYKDSLINTSYGMAYLNPSDPSSLRGTGASWTRTVTVNVNKAPDTGRFLQGSVGIVSGTFPSSITLRSAEINVKF